ncbi:MAG: M6 family metalloprotease domain-containing protein [Paludibacteraceae bacterium]|nr:M6 family metalloprotease domain-containing protein [Paludibacteraceae bacterium]
MKKLLLSTIVSIVFSSMTYAVPARPVWQTKTQPDGTTIQLRLAGDEFYHYWQDRSGNIVRCNADGYWQVLSNEAIRQEGEKAMRRKASAISQQKRAIGDRNFAPRGLVILVNFKDASFNAANTQSAMNDLMNSDSYTYNGATGSVRQYFSDQSDGQYTPQFDVVGPVTLAKNMKTYGANDSEGNDKLPGDMIVEACSIANALHNVDFTQYDNNNDGYVDFVYVIYAGLGEADGGAENTIWPHNWDLTSAAYYGNCTYNESKRKFDGKIVNDYACSGEITGIYNEAGNKIKDVRTTIGTIAHEFSHVIGLPDLYDIDYGQNYEDEKTPGSWHIMDGGGYNNNGNTPPNYTIFDKYFLGWQTPTNPGNTAQNISLIAAGQDGYQGYQITTGNSLVNYNNTNTVYYIENRQQSGWDEHLPGHGLVIWKVAYNQSAWDDNGPNDQDGTLRYTIVSASGKTSGLGTEADPFPGTKNKTSWNGVSGKPLKNITEKNGVITLTYISDPDAEQPTDPENPTDPETPTGEIVFIPSDFNATSDTEFSVDKSGVTMHCTKGTINANQFRFFANEKATISVASGKITKIEFTCTASGSEKYGPGCFTASEGTYSVSGQAGTWTGNTESVTFSTSKQVRATKVVVTVSGGSTDEGGEEPEEPTDPEEPNDPSEPTSTEITGLRYADAVFVADAEYGDYWVFDLYSGWNDNTNDYIYPDLYVMVNESHSKTAICGTYNVLYTEYMPKADELIVSDEYAEDFVGTLTIQQAAGNGNYSFQGTFTDTQGTTYTYNQVVEVYAYEYLYDEATGEGDYKNITLDETGNTEDPEEPTDPENPNEPNDPQEPELFEGEVVFIPSDFQAITDTKFCIDKQDVSICCSKGSITADQFRFFKSQDVTISVGTGTITSIEFTCTANDDAKYGPGGFGYLDDYSYSGKTGLWQGNANSVTFNTTYSQVRATKIVVTVSNPTTDIDNTTTPSQSVQKIIQNGQLLIMREGKIYTILGHRTTY